MYLLTMAHLDHSIFVFYVCLELGGGSNLARLLEPVGIMGLTGISIFTGEFYIKQVPTIKLDWNPLQVQDKHKNINMLQSKCAIVNNYMQHGIEFRFNSSIFHMELAS